MQFSTVLSLLLSASAALAAPTPVEKRTTACSPVGIPAQVSAAVVSAFKSSGVVPTLIPSISPTVVVAVAYGSKEVLLGNKFTTARTYIKANYTVSRNRHGSDVFRATIETTTQPSLAFDAEKSYPASTTKYSYFLIDPDVPNPDAGALRMTYLHWAVSNVRLILTNFSARLRCLFDNIYP